MAKKISAWNFVLPATLSEIAASQNQDDQVKELVEKVDTQDGKMGGWDERSSKVYCIG